MARLAFPFCILSTFTYFNIENNFNVPTAPLPMIYMVYMPVQVNTDVGGYSGVFPELGGGGGFESAQLSGQKRCSATTSSVSVCRAIITMRHHDRA